MAVCLTNMYVKSRNSIKFQVIRKYRSLFTQATARSETRNASKKKVLNRKIETRAFLE